MKETITIHEPDGAIRSLEIGSDAWRTIRYAEDGKPAIMVKLSKEKISAAPLRERLRRLEAEIAEPLNDAGE